MPVCNLERRLLKQAETINSLQLAAGASTNQINKMFFSRLSRLKCWQRISASGRSIRYNQSKLLSQTQGPNLAHNNTLMHIHKCTCIQTYLHINNKKKIIVLPEDNYTRVSKFGVVLSHCTSGTSQRSRQKLTNKRQKTLNLVST